MPCAVGEDLDLDVARVLEVALDVDAVVGEELLAFAGRAFEGLLQVVRGHRDAKALAAAAARRLAGDRVAGFLGLLAGRLDVGRGLGGAGHDRHAGLGHDLARAGLRAHRVDRLRRRADEDDAGLGAGAGEVGVLGEEAVARVDRLGTRLLGVVDDLDDVQIALGRHRRPDQEGLVGLAHVRRVAVDLRVDGDRADAHLLERAGDADRDLAAVGYEDLLEHGGAVYWLNATASRVKLGCRLHADRASEPLDRLRRAAGARRSRGGSWEAGVTTLALTDHDAIAGVSEATEAAEGLGVELVPAIEMSCVHEYAEDLHVCGYWVDLGRSRQPASGPSTSG